VGTSLINLKQRAKLIARIRTFFENKNILEVETPLLSTGRIPDPHIQSMETECLGKKYYLQTSPECYMKRLLAAGSGDIYQITKAFRNNELGHKHEPEFTLLEYYRLGFNHHDLMADLDELLQYILNSKKSDKISYLDLFIKYLNLNPHKASLTELQNCAQQNKINLSSSITDKDTWLNLLLSHLIEPKLGFDQPIFIYDYPATQAALAKVKNNAIGERFELYINGLELANGYHELTDVTEQKKQIS